MSTTVLNTLSSLERQAHLLEGRILDLLDEQAVLGLDTLVELLPEYSWNQIFQTVDHLARVGRIVLRRHRFDYTLFSANYAA